MRHLLSFLGLAVFPVYALAQESPAVTESNDQDTAWIATCVARIEAARVQLGRSDPRFAEAWVRATKLDGGKYNSVSLHMPTRGPTVEDYWIEVTDHTGHRWPDRTDGEFADWVPIPWTPPLPYPTLIRHIHPMGARIQGNEAVGLARWQTFIGEFVPVIERCLAREL